MTVIVGILCEDGVVIGSDSSGTLAAGQFRTIEQPVKKTSIVSDHILLASTGQLGLAQRFENVLLKFREQCKFTDVDRFTLAKGISSAAINDFASTEAPKGQIGAIVAFQSASGFHLCEFEASAFQPEFKTDEQWFSCMGSGQPITDPLLAMLRRVFFKDKKPRLKEGLFAVTWALLHAIELNPGGINGPPQVGILRSSGGSKRLTAELLNDDQLAEHIDNVRDAERHIAEYRDILAGNAPAPASSPPPSPPAPS
jgi:20S proteasome alpha/beta subunit